MKVKFFICACFCFIVAFISSCDLKSKTNHQDTIGDISQDRDTMRLFCRQFACDCPDWANDSLFQSFTKQYPDSSFDSRFLNTYYIEPVGNIKLEDGAFGWVVEFYGHNDTNRRLIENYDYMSSEPIKGKIFMYSGYKIIHK